MTKSKIAVFAFSLILLTTTLTAHEVYGTEEDLPFPIQQGGTGSEKSIPDWVDQNFRWYGEGVIAQSELINAIKYLIDEEIMILEKPTASSGYSGERIMQPEYGTDDKASDTVLGAAKLAAPHLPGGAVLNEQMNQDRMDSWKNEIMHGVESTSESDPDEIDRVKVKFPWLPEGLEGDPDRPIIVGGISSSDSHGVFIMDKNDESTRLFLKILESKLLEEITQAEVDQETLRNDRQLSSSQFENANQKASQYINMVSSVMKTINEMNQGIIRNMR